MSEAPVILTPPGRIQHEPVDPRRYDPAIKLEPYLQHFLTERFAYKRDRVNRVGFTLNAKRVQYDLYLRVFGHKTDFWPEGTLVIARIGFKKIKKGHGTALLRILVEHADEVGFAHIAIECANENAQAFGVKLGFENYCDNHFIADVATVRKHLPHLLHRQQATASAQ